jgi:hypothetical protein
MHLARKACDQTRRYSNALRSKSIAGFCVARGQLRLRSCHFYFLFLGNILTCLTAFSAVKIWLFCTLQSCGSFGDDRIFDWCLRFDRPCASILHDTAIAPFFFNQLCQRRAADWFGNQDALVIDEKEQL